MKRFLSFGAALAAAAVAMFAPTTARAEFCTGLGNGLYCDANVLKNCQGGVTSSSQNCACGCQVMPPGTPDQCATCSGDFCSGQSNGLYCDGNALKNCQGGVTASSQNCACGCQVMPPGTPDQCATCGSDFCVGKGSGLYCDGSALKNCVNGVTSSSQNCACGCQVMPPGTPDQCSTCAPSDFCNGKADGAWCNSGALAMCAGGVTASSTPCPNGCVNNPPGTPDACAATGGGFCTGKNDGSYCNSATLVECVSGTQTSVKDCPSGCTILDGNLPDVCSTPGGGGFCSDKTDGYWCNGDMLVACKGGALSSGLNCANGCQSMPAGQDDKCVTSSPNVPPGQSVTVTDVNGCASFSGNLDLYSGKGLPIFDQTDYSDQLGTCADTTISSDGCLITSFSMLYAYLGLTRTVNGETGINPPLENAWRKANGGYTGGCLAYWNVNPPGLTMQSHTNPTLCVSTSAAQAIATSLNSGMPVIAGVHWGEDCSGSCENWHWVLVVGADAGGLIINDPYGGHASVHLDIHKPKYILDWFFTPVLAGSGGAGGPGVAVDESGVPLEGDDAFAPKPINPGTSGATDTSGGVVGELMCAAPSYSTTTTFLSGGALLSALGLLVSRRARKNQKAA